MEFLSAMERQKEALKLPVSA